VSILAAIVAAAAAVLVPLLPLLVLAGGIWLLVRLTRPAPSVTRA
jgi:hypothetical protein